MSAIHQTRAHRLAAAAITTPAKADPTYRCPDCGLTLTQRQRTHPHAHWQAGHQVIGRPELGYKGAICSTCNQREAANHANQIRKARYG